MSILCNWGVHVTDDELSTLVFSSIRTYKISLLELQITLACNEKRMAKKQTDYREMLYKDRFELRSPVFIPIQDIQYTYGAHQCKQTNDCKYMITDPPSFITNMQTQFIIKWPICFIIILKLFKQSDFILLSFLILFTLIVALGETPNFKQAYDEQKGKIVTRALASIEYSGKKASAYSEIYGGKDKYSWIDFRILHLSIGYPTLHALDPVGDMLSFSHWSIGKNLSFKFFRFRFIQLCFRWSTFLSDKIHSLYSNSLHVKECKCQLQS